MTQVRGKRLTALGIAARIEPGERNLTEQRTTLVADPVRGTDTLVLMTNDL